MSWSATTNMHSPEARNDSGLMFSVMNRPLSQELVCLGSSFLQAACFLNHDRRPGHAYCWGKSVVVLAMTCLDIDMKWVVCVYTYK